MSDADWKQWEASMGDRHRTVTERAAGPIVGMLIVAFTVFLLGIAAYALWGAVAG